MRIELIINVTMNKEKNNKRSSSRLFSNEYKTDKLITLTKNIPSPRINQSTLYIILYCQPRQEYKGIKAIRNVIYSNINSIKYIFEETIFSNIVLLWAMDKKC